MTQQSAFSHQIQHNLTLGSSQIDSSIPDSGMKLDNNVQQAFLSSPKIQTKIPKQFQSINIIDFDVLFDYSTYNEDEQIYQKKTDEKCFNIQQTPIQSTTAHNFEKKLEYFDNFNCPICGINILPNHDSIPFLLKNIRRTFHFHKECYNNLSVDKILDFKNTCCSNEASLTSQQYKPLQINEDLNFTHFFAEFTVSHPLNNIIYLKILKKIPIQKHLLIWNFNSDNRILQHPNLICLPFLDFKVRLIVELATLTFTFEFNLNLNETYRQRKLKFRALATTPQQIYMQGQIIETFDQIKALIKEMNYKYPYNLEYYPLIKINSISFKISTLQQKRLYAIQNFLLISQIEDLDRKNMEHNYELQGQRYDQSNFNSIPYYYDNKFNLCPFQKIQNLQYTNFDYQQYNYQNYQIKNYQQQQQQQQFSQQPQSHQLIAISNQQQYYQYILQNHKYQSQQFFNIDQQIQEQDKQIYKAIFENKIPELISTNLGSRNAQRFLLNCSNQDRDLFIGAVYHKLQQLVICPYGNYTFQSLINMCSPQKKRIMINKLVPHIPRIAKTKQGTHALQTMVSFTTFDFEIELIKSSIQTQILTLSKHVHATYFIQKVLKVFGSINYEHIDFIYRIVLQNLREYAKDSNGILVVRVLMTQINKINFLSARLLEQIKKNLEIIIQDPYGNYIIQAIYDLFQQDLIKPITQKIMQKFIQYSINRYSCNVIINCLKMKDAKEFLNAAEQTLLKCKQFNQISKSIPGLHIIKIIFQKSQNEQVIQYLKILFKQKLNKLSWLESIPRNDLKEAQTEKLDNKSNFNTAVADNVLEKEKNVNKNENSNFIESNKEIKASKLKSKSKKTETNKVLKKTQGQEQ